MKRLASLILIVVLLPGCVVFRAPYTGKNPDDERFERGRPNAVIDTTGDLLSKIPQLLFWTRQYGNHQVSPETEAAVRRFLNEYGLGDVKVRINQWSPHGEIARLVRNPHVAWPYKILFFPSTLITSVMGRPLSGLLISDYFDPASNTINLFSDETTIALHEAGHARDFALQKRKGTYSLVRIVPGVNLVQEGIATDEALYYLEDKEDYDELLRGYKVLYPAYCTYGISYLASSTVAFIGAVTFGHIWGRREAAKKKRELIAAGKIDEAGRPVIQSAAPALKQTN
jgi:hypothetical protein